MLSIPCINVSVFRYWFVFIDGRDKNFVNVDTTIGFQLPHWPVIKRQAFLAGLSAYQSEEVGRDENVTGNEDSETLTAMAGLSVCRTNSNKNIVWVLQGSFYILYVHIYRTFSLTTILYFPILCITLRDGFLRVRYRKAMINSVLLNINIQSEHVVTRGITGANGPGWVEVNHWKWEKAML